MKNSKMKKIIISIVIIVFLLVILFACTKQKNKEDIQNNNTIKWDIKLTDKENNSFSETNKIKFTTKKTNHISVDKIAPGTEATANLIIDPTGSNTAIDYSIEVDVNEFTFINVKSIKATINENEILELLNVDGVWKPNTDVGISLNDVKLGKKVILEITLFWDDKNQNNEEDTNIGKNEELIELDITVNAKQHID